ncbi:unnamed protein product [Closterium sp. NIES-65]|nr:unnamed protein product [Closterium sp. NIES-65]
MPRRAAAPPPHNPSEQRRLSLTTPQSSGASSSHPPRAAAPPPHTPPEQRRLSLTTPQSSGASSSHPPRAAAPLPHNPPEQRRLSLTAPQSSGASSSHPPRAAAPPPHTPPEQRRLSLTPPQSSGASPSQPPRAAAPLPHTPPEQRRLSSQPPRAAAPLPHNPPEQRRLLLTPPQSSGASSSQPAGAFCLRPCALDISQPMARHAHLMGEWSAGGGEPHSAGCSSMAVNASQRHQCESSKPAPMPSLPLWRGERQWQRGKPHGGSERAPARHAGDAGRRGAAAALERVLGALPGQRVHAGSKEPCTVGGKGAGQGNGGGSAGEAGEREHGASEGGWGGEGVAAFCSGAGEAVLRHMDDEEPRVRLAAAEALCALSHYGSLPATLTLFRPNGMQAAEQKGGGCSSMAVLITHAHSIAAIMSSSACPSQPPIAGAPLPHSPPEQREMTGIGQSGFGGQVEGAGGCSG